MIKTEIIPAIDILGGKCVRLSQGDYSRQKVYNEHPLEVARMFEDAGVRRLHLVDLDGAREKRLVNHKVLELLASKTNLIIDFGGGLQSSGDLKIAFESGAAMVTGGSIAVRDRILFLQWIKSYGADRIILGADAKNGKIAISGWQEDSGEEILPFIQSWINEGITQVISTDISKDGMLQGPSFDLYTAILEQFPALHLIASGGVASMDDIRRLNLTGIPAVIAGKAIYESRITLTEIRNYILESF